MLWLHDFKRVGVVMTTWIFQCNPDRYDLPGALRESSVETWLANQSRSEIKAGDSVYLWETGKEAGVLAVATVISDPAVMPQSPGEAKFSLGDLIPILRLVDRCEPMGILRET